MNHTNFFTYHINLMKDYTPLLLVIVTALALSSCRGQLSEEPAVHPNMNMDQQKRFELQEENDFFDDKRSLRQPVKGTVSRGNLKKDKAYYLGMNKDSSFIDHIPVDVTKSFMRRGKDRYEVFCAPCHGNAGYGKGIIMEGDYSYVPAPSYHQKRLRDAKDGYMYDVIANGIRNMPSYGHQIPVKDRWAIVAYMRALQRSQHVPEEEVKKYDVDIASLQSEYKSEQKKAEKAKEAQKPEGGGEISAARGKKIAGNNACQSCHSVDGSKMVGPTWKNAFGHEVELKSGKTVTANEDYIYESIVEPNAKIVKGYPAAMPPYKQLSESKIKSLIAYIKSLSNKEDAGS